MEIRTSTHICVITVESVNFEPPLVTELNAEPPPARYTASGQPWDSAMEVIYFASSTNTVIFLTFVLSLSLRVVIKLFIFLFDAPLVLKWLQKFPEYLTCFT